MPLKIGEFLEFKLDQLQVLSLFHEALHFLDNLDDTATAGNASSNRSTTSTSNSLEEDATMDSDTAGTKQSTAKALVEKLRQKGLGKTRIHYYLTAINALLPGS